MTILMLDEEQAAPEEIIELGSKKHSYVQARLTYLLTSLGHFDVFTELSLDTTGLEDEMLRRQYKDAIKPDVCVYPKQKHGEGDEDDVKMVVMPLLAIEILSPYQPVEVLVRKVRAYFSLGVQSYWIVYPSSETIRVYKSPTEKVSFSQNDVVDEQLGIRLPLDEIFW